MNNNVVTIKRNRPNEMTSAAICALFAVICAAAPFFARGSEPKNIVLCVAGGLFFGLPAFVTFYVSSKYKIRLVIEKSGFTYYRAFKPGLFVPWEHVGGMSIFDFPFRALAFRPEAFLFITVKVNEPYKNEYINESRVWAWPANKNKAFREWLGRGSGDIYIGLGLSKEKCENVLKVMLGCLADSRKTQATCPLGVR